MTEQDKIDALMENPEVKAFIQEIDGTEAEDMQAAEAKPGEPEMTILDAMKTIINRAEVRIERSNRYYDESFYRYSDSFVKENAKESGFLASQLGVTPRQAVLFTIIVEVSKGESVDAKELSQNLQANFVELLGYDGDIKALEKARLIHRGRMGGLLVPDEVQKCLRANKPYRRPSTEGLGTLEILLRMATIFHSIEERDDNVERALSEIDEMILANPATSIARTMNEYGILCHDAKPDVGDVEGDYDNAFKNAERMVFYILCFFYQEKEEDNVTWWMTRAYLDPSWLPHLQTRFNCDALDLQKSGVVTYAGDSSLADKDRFKLTDEAKEGIFQDCGGLQASGKMLPGVIAPESIPPRELFFDRAVEQQVDRLQELLAEDRYREVEGMLRSKGLRPGASGVHLPVLRSPGNREDGDGLPDCPKDRPRYHHGRCVQAQKHVGRGKREEPQASLREILHLRPPFRESPHSLFQRSRCHLRHPQVGSRGCGGQDGKFPAEHNPAGDGKPQRDTDSDNEPHGEP